MRGGISVECKPPSDCSVPAHVVSLTSCYISRLPRRHLDLVENWLWNGKRNWSFPVCTYYDSQTYVHCWATSSLVSSEILNSNLRSQTDVTSWHLLSCKSTIPIAAAEKSMRHCGHMLTCEEEAARWEVRMENAYKDYRSSSWISICPECCNTMVRC